VTPETARFVLALIWAMYLVAELGRMWLRRPPLVPIGWHVLYWACCGFLGCVSPPEVVWRVTLIVIPFHAFCVVYFRIVFGGPDAPVD